MSHVALWASVIGLVFLPYQHNEIKVVPDVMLKFNVFLEWYSLIIKLVPLEACWNTNTDEFLSVMFSDDLYVGGCHKAC